MGDIVLGDGVIDMEQVGTDNMTEQEYTLAGWIPMISCYIDKDYLTGGGQYDLGIIVGKDSPNPIKRALTALLQEVHQTYPMLSFGVAVEKADWED